MQLRQILDLPLFSSGDILERSFLVCVKPDDELFCNFLASEFTAVTLIANTGITPILHILEWFSKI